VERAFGKDGQEGPPEARDGQAGAGAPLLASGKARIIVVDDEAALGRVLARTLGDEYEVHTSTSGKDALARLASGERFDVILSDLMMPRMTGMELHERVQSLAPDQAARMIFLTGGAFTQASREFLERIPNEWVEKPFQPATLLAVMAKVIGAMGGRVRAEVGASLTSSEPERAPPREPG
jgi:CheY-like chemotaxis protein